VPSACDGNMNLLILSLMGFPFSSAGGNCHAASVVNMRSSDLWFGLGSSSLRRLLRFSIIFFVYRRTYDRKLAHHLRQVLFVLHINRWATKSDTSVANPPVPYFRNCVTKNRIIGESKMWNRKQKESLNMRTLCQIFVITEYQPVFLETQTFAVMGFVKKNQCMTSKIKINMTSVQTKIKDIFQILTLKA